MRNVVDRGLIGESAKFKAALKQVDLVAPSDCAVLIQGETGTGKELIAQAIHARSLRSNGPFVKLNCAAIPTGLLETSCSGMSVARLREPLRRAWAGSMPPITEHCFWMKSAICRWSFSRNFSALFRNRSSSGWEARKPFASTSGL